MIHLRSSKCFCVPVCVNIAYFRLSTAAMKRGDASICEIEDISCVRCIWEVVLDLILCCCDIPSAGKFIHVW